MVWKHFTCHRKIWKSCAGLPVRVKVPAQEWKRARYLILLHEGEDPATACRCLDIRRNLGNQWLRKYKQNGLSFLHLKDYTGT